MRILWHSNAPFVGSGYGVQTKHVIEMLTKLGHEVLMSNFAGMHGRIMETPVMDDDGEQRSYHILPHGERGAYNWWPLRIERLTLDRGSRTCMTSPVRNASRN